MFGQFYLLFTIMQVVAGMAGPAFDTSLVRFAARHIRPGSDASAPYFKAMFYAKCGLLVLTLAVGLVLMVPLLHLLFTGPDGLRQVPGYAVLIAFLGGGATSMWGFAQAYLQAYQRFYAYAAFEFLSSSLRLTLVVVLFLAGVTDVVAYLAAYVAAPSVMWAVSWLLLPRELFRASTNSAVAGELFRFARWVLLATLFTTLTQRLDLLLLGAFSLPEETVGHYSAAVSLVLLGELVLLTFYNVLLPKASAFKEVGELRRFIGSFRIPTLFLCLGMSLLMFAAPFLSELFFGSDYSGMELYFSILLSGIIVSLGAAPAATALYSVGSSHLMAVFEGLRFVATLLLAVVVIPRHGAMGMAFVTAGARATMSVALYIVAHQRIKRLTIEEYTAGASPPVNQDHGQ
jgi:O-antigen/teichoic acid export membrane protein